MRRELGARWMWASAVGQLAVAWAGATAGYQVGRWGGPGAGEGAAASQEVAAAVSRVREAPRFPERAVGAADLAAAALIQEILRCALGGPAAAGGGRGGGRARGH